MWTTISLTSGISTATNLTACFHQGADEGDVTRQPVQLGYQQLGAMDAAQGERLGTVAGGWLAALAAFDFHHFLYQFPPAAVQIAFLRRCAALPVPSQSVLVAACSL